jgi:tRNA (guanosine-2'-O-)-methyltransferase
MDGMVGSLNVSVANAVILFEVQRQRQQAGLYKERRLDDTEYKTLLFEFAYPEVAAVLKRKSESYPELDKEGQIIR